MSPADHALQVIKNKRFRTLRTSNPFCVTCGERRWWVPYELHHTAGRKYSDQMIRLCLNCHYGINVMQKILPKLDDSLDPELAKVIAMVEGQKFIMECAAEHLGETATVLRARMPQTATVGQDQ
jgi:nitrate/TMAO reductase-like tetraheme cytochrome c subunit